MGSKCVTILIVVMELLVLIFIEGQAKDLVLTSFHPTFRTQLPPYSPELDSLQSSQLADCLTERIENCGRSWQPLSMKHYLCATKSFTKCMDRHPGDPLLPEVEGCIQHCFQERNAAHIQYFEHPACLLKCHEDRIKKHAKMVHSENP